jgi:hypothetical protein
MEGDGVAVDGLVLAQALIAASGKVTFMRPSQLYAVPFEILHTGNKQGA